MAKFKPYKIESSQLEDLSISEGQFIVTTDTNKIYLDEDNATRIELSPSPTKTSELINDSDFMSGMYIAKYGITTYGQILDAYSKNHIVYCRASSSSDPASGSQTRMAFLAYVQAETNPTEFEFQYYRSVSTHSDSTQGDEVYIYKINKNSGWSVTKRNAYTKVVAGTGMSSSYSNGTITLNATNNGTVTQVTAGTGLTTGQSSADITSTGTLSLDTSGVTAGTYQGITVDSYGRVTAASDQGYTTNTGTITGVSVNGTSVATSGTANITSVPASILTGAIPSAVTATTQSQGDNSTKIATTAYVDTAIDNLPEPMVFKGSLGTGGTITSLPVDGSATIGDTYKVITDGTYASKAAKVGDTFICLTKTSNANTWELIPSGDEPSGTVTSITLNATSPINIDSSSAITTSGTRTLSHANSGVTAGTYKSVTVNATGHVTAGSNPTTISGYGITDAKIDNGVITLGSNTITPLTSGSTLDATKLSGTIPSECYTDTNTTYTLTQDTTDGHKIIFTPSSGSATEIIIPDNNTTYSAGTGLSLNGTTINHSNSVTAGTAGTSSATSGSTLDVPYVTYDAQGHITASGTHTHTISGFATTDTKNTAGTTNTTDKIYLAGGKSQGDNPQTYSNVNCYASGGKLYSNAKEVVNLSDTQSLTNKTYDGLTLTKATTGFTIAGGTTSKTLTVNDTYTLGAACAKAVDSSISAASTSTNLPTSQAVASFVEGKGYTTNGIHSFYGTTDPTTVTGSVDGDIYIVIDA